jgi:hypothetical protein
MPEGRPGFAIRQAAFAAGSRRGLLWLLWLLWRFWRRERLWRL